MKYFLIAGEASGDLHASRLMQALRNIDDKAEFRFYGGDRMSAAGGMCLCHYRKIAYMGFIPVLLHARTILRAMKTCKQSILHWNPDVVILVDYPGFNLSIAKFVRRHTGIPVYYYISPKIWAWKEHRIRQIRENVSELFSILPFEIPFFEEKHHYPIHYVGNPSVDEITQFKNTYHESSADFAGRYGLSPRQPIIALLPGSRKQEVKDNLRRMGKAAEPFVSKGYQIVIAGVTDLPRSYYVQHCPMLETDAAFHLIEEATYPLLMHAEAALVTSGTATLETALIGTPQAVCYYAPLGMLVRFLKRHLLHVPYISLVNLILGREVVPELIADQMNIRQLRSHLAGIIKGGSLRTAMLEGYHEMSRKLGSDGSSARTARMMFALLSQQKQRP